eukprot:GHRR01028553.1.p1 GENE.GHRR01028553.1~~GHRR01028553.1.p1  ORF type:complete len:131 (+),score=20.66 GHRR01028553.1:244-636(+)
MIKQQPKDERERHGAPRVMASAPSVVQQARLMDVAGTAWHAVKCGNLEMITKLFPNQSNVYARGPVGENVMHVAMLLNTPSTLAITRYLVKLYGSQLVNCPIQVCYRSCATCLEAYHTEDLVEGWFPPRS